jgi:putative ABC transport system ATP-binding protein
MGTENLIHLQQLGKSFLTEEVETRALSGIDLSIKKGEYLCLTGASGCGKSTLLSLVGLLDTATAGSYHLNGMNVVDLTRDDRALIRNKEIGFVFQAFNLISDLTVEENVMLPLTYQKGLKTKYIREQAQKMLEKVDMGHRIKHYPSQLSGGQQQRVAIARSLINEPSIILADEPTGNLDSKNAEAVMNVFQQLHNEGSTICMVTHDPRSAEQASRQVEMFDGKIINDSAKTYVKLDQLSREAEVVVNEESKECI